MGSIYQIPVLRGAAEVLVSRREMRNKYCTNREIREWAVFFMLKALTRSGKLQNWLKQKEFLLNYLGVNEQTFRSRISALKKIGLVEVDRGYSINLAAYKKAAGILGIQYHGCDIINYDSSQANNNVFSYSISALEIKNNQDLQRNALLSSIDKNPVLAGIIYEEFLIKGFDEYRLQSDPEYYQKCLLRLQLSSFKNGSENYALIMQRRADVNRGVKKIAETYNYKSTRSATYLKHVMLKCGVITGSKMRVTSDVRSRRYIPGEDGKLVDGYQYLPRQKATRWSLTDQIIVNDKIISKNAKQKILCAAA